MAKKTTTTTKATTKKTTGKKAASTTKKAAPKKKATTTKRTPKPNKIKKVEVKVNPESKDEYGIAKSKDLPWCQKKVDVFKALAKLGAISKETAATTTALADETKLSNRDVRHYIYHARVSGLTDLCQVEDERGYSFFLTKKGQEIDPQAEWDSQEEAKASKTKADK